MAYRLLFSPIPSKVTACFRWLVFGLQVCGEHLPPVTVEDMSPSWYLKLRPRLIGIRNLIRNFRVIFFPPLRAKTAQPSSHMTFFFRRISTLPFFLPIIRVEWRPKSRPGKRWPVSWDSNSLKKEWDLAPVVQKLDSAVHWINHYPVDTY